MRILTVTLLFYLFAGINSLLAQTIPPGSKIAFFDFYFTDSSTEGAMNGVRPDEQERLRLSQKYVEDNLIERGFELISLEPVAEEIARTKNPGKCNGCAAKMAKKLGADYAMTGEVQKVSNLILSMNLVLTTAGDNKVIAQGVVDIRGNNDASWQRGFRYILRNRIFFD